VKRRGVAWIAAAVALGAGTVVLVRDPGAAAALVRDHGAAGSAAGAAVSAGVGSAPGVTPASTGTAQVVRTDLATTMPLFGQLGYAHSVTVAGVTGGHAYTWLPAPGAVIVQGQPLYEVDGRAVPLLAGDRPSWRTLANGVSPGPDIAALNTDLVVLRYAQGIAGNPHFTAGTQAAVSRWQRALGVPATGRIEWGQVAFAPAPLRVQDVPAGLGSQPVPGQPVLTATSTERVVELSVPVDQAYLLHERDPVTITLPDGHSTTPGGVRTISAVARRPSDSEPGRGEQATVDVTIGLADPAAAAAYTSAPVSVALTTASVHGVLAVPVTALLARPGGDFAVTVVDGANHREVAVTTGLFADTLVLVSGDGLAEGDTVEVPAS
jgi:peptidoglycan hydrolase-like protein with peptidoglycan-binding domain